ncbi:MAG: hypothetical protein IJR90_02845 [Clostridia bacterium]|nr:hypothetical protein [Clostridia bacterium]
MKKETSSGVAPVPPSAVSAIEDDRTDARSAGVAPVPPSAVSVIEDDRTDARSAGDRSDAVEVSSGDGSPSPQSPDGDSSPSPLTRGKELCEAVGVSFGDENETAEGSCGADSDTVEVSSGDCDASDGCDSPVPAALISRIAADISLAERVIPGFDMEREMADPRFVRLAATEGVIAAYDAVHRREREAALVAVARREAEAAASAMLSANLARPSEGGMARTAAPPVRRDPAHLTDEERLDVRRRLIRGERITFK